MENIFDNILSGFNEKEKNIILGFNEKFIFDLMKKRIEVLGIQGIDEYVALIQADSAEKSEFMSSQEVSYSEFFRNPLTFTVLSQIIIPEIVQFERSKRSNDIRIWSAACAAGQEAYSLAILLEEYSTISETHTEYNIFATDINQYHLELAEAGKFDSLSVRNVSLRRINEFFESTNGYYEIKDKIKKHINFSIFNLLLDDCVCPPASIFGDFDIVLCANLLFYYKPEYQQKILKKIKKCLSANGFIITGETERDIMLNNGFIELFPKSCVFKK